MLLLALLSALHIGPDWPRSAGQEFYPLQPYPASILAVALSVPLAGHSEPLLSLMHSASILAVVLASRGHPAARRPLQVVSVLSVLASILAVTLVSRHHPGAPRLLQVVSVLSVPASILAVVLVSRCHRAANRLLQVVSVWPVLASISASSRVVYFHTPAVAVEALAVCPGDQTPLLALASASGVTSTLAGLPHLVPAVWDEKVSGYVAVKLLVVSGGGKEGVVVVRLEVTMVCASAGLPAVPARVTVVAAVADVHKPVLQPGVHADAESLL